MRKRSQRPPAAARLAVPELEVARLLQQGETRQALKTAVRALSAGRRNPELSNLAGVCAANSGDETLAAQLWRHALELDPHHAQAWYNLGLMHHGKGDIEAAEQAFRQATQNDPANLEAWLALGDLWYGRQRPAEAQAAYQAVLGLDPGHAQAHNNLALIAEHAGQTDQALAHYQQALLRAPDTPEILSNHANLLSRLRREAEAEPLLQKVLQLAPDSARNHTNLGVLYANMGRLEAAQQCFQQALRLQPDYALPRLNLSYAQLKQGNFREGWPNHEARYSPRLPDNGIPSPDISAPQWHGEPLDGKHLLVWMEQGYGDQIQFARYLALLKRRWRVTITLICRKGLVALLQTLKDADFVYSADLAPDQGYDYWVFPLSLPWLCGGMSESDIPADLPYLGAPPERLQKWRHALPSDKFRVGLAWQGNPHHHNDGSRSMPPQLLSPLLALPHVCFVGVQPGAALPGLLPLTQSLQDFADTAALLEQLDLVLSVDTAVAHLAGAIGKSCWVLLPHYRTDWRWLLEREDSPWYPGVMRLFRQGEDESWAPVIKRVTAALAEIAGRRFYG